MWKNGTWQIGGGGGRVEGGLVHARKTMRRWATRTTEARRMAVLEVEEVV
jgi:hypothetical protein